MPKKIPLRTLIILIVGLGFVGFILLIYSSQQWSMADLSGRLHQAGVPVVDVTVGSRIPFRVAINLQSASSGDSLSIDDNWNMVLTHREATLSYRTGIRLASYKVDVFNTLGKVISSAEYFIYPQDISQNEKAGTAVVDNVTTRELIRSDLVTGDLSIDILDVYQDQGIEPSGQVLILQVSGQDLQQVNDSLPGFMGSFLHMLDTVNTQSETNLNLCHLRVKDKAGNILIDFVRDLDGGTSQWTLAEGVYSDWFPQPKPAPTPSPEPTGNGPGYPAPPTAVPTATLHSYPKTKRLPWVEQLSLLNLTAAVLNKPVAPGSLFSPHYSLFFLHHTGGHLLPILQQGLDHGLAAPLSIHP